MNPDGTGDTQVEVKLPNPLDPVWSRDGRLIAIASLLAPKGSVYYNTFNAFVFNPTTGVARQITNWPDTFTSCTDECTEDCTQVYSKAFSSDGARLAVVSMRSSVFWQLQDGYWDSKFLTSCPIVEVYDTHGKNAKVVVGGQVVTNGAMHQGDGLDWVPNKELLICPWTVTAGLGQATALVAVAPVKGALDAGLFRKLTTPKFLQYYGNYGVGVCYDQDFQPAVGPVSNRVAYVRERDCVDGGNPVSHSTISVRMVNLDGTGDRAIYSVPAGKYVSHLNWAPDESKLVLSCGDQAVVEGWPIASLYDNTVRIALLNPDGTGFRQISGPGDDYPAWNPLGLRILPVPSVASINPAAVKAGGKSFNLTVNGKGFNGLPATAAGGVSQASKILWNGSALPTRYVSPTTLVAAVPAADIKTPGNVKISVLNPPPGGGASNAATLTIGNPAAHPPP
jgi:hypothetical protein